MEATKPLAAFGVEELSTMPPHDFVERIKRDWNKTEQGVDAILSLVDREILNPYEGARQIACIVGEKFSYSQFHGSILTAPVPEVLETLKSLSQGRG